MASSRWRYVRPAVALLAVAALPLFTARAAEEPAPVNLDEIRTLLRLGQPKEALPPAEAAARNAPLNPAAHLLLGRALLALEQPNNAAEALSAATRLDPKNAEAFALLGEAHFQRAGVNLREWLRKSRISVAVHTEADVVGSLPGGGHTHASSFTMETVVTDRSATRMRGKDWEDYTAIAREALAAFNAALALDADNKPAMRGRGLAQLVLGDWKGTADAFEAAGAPVFDTFVYELVGANHDPRAMADEAMRFWAASERTDPTNGWTYWYQQALYRQSKRGDWRNDYYAAMVKLFEDMIQGGSGVRASAPKDALKGLEAVIEKHEDFAPAWRGIGIAAAALKDTERARKAFEKAASLDEKDWFSHLQLGMMLLTAKDPAAEVTLARAAQGNPESPVAWQALGIAIERTGDLDGAVYCYERAALLAPTSPEAHYSLGALQLARREDPKALLHLQRYLDLKPDAPDAADVRAAINQIRDIIEANG